MGVGESFSDLVDFHRKDKILADKGTSSLESPDFANTQKVNSAYIIGSNLGKR